MKETCTCHICGCQNANKEVLPLGEKIAINCPLCGKYILTDSLFCLNEDGLVNNNKQYNLKHLSAYLYHNKQTEWHAFLGTDKTFNLYKKENAETQSFLVSPEMVENWYPKTFAEKVDKILLALGKKSKYFGDPVIPMPAEFYSLFFMTNKLNMGGKNSLEVELEVEFLLEYFLLNDYIVGYSKEIDLYEVVDRIQDLPKKPTEVDCSYYLPQFALAPKAWERIYDLQKNQVNNKNVFVAMKFGEDTEELRQKIKEGLDGFNVRIMDEIEHNHQIVPEMLYEIKNSRFVIAELSHHNNGAYYEAGYALGLGKEVIHICKRSEIENGLHFDVSQINTIPYDDISEIPDKLKKRIKATIQ